MLSVLEAERLKLARHRATWFLVWIYPIGLTLIFLLWMAWELSGMGRAEPPGPPETAAGWAADTAFPWAGPSSTLGRYAVAAFVAVAFGGEYVWNTWKLIVPHRERVLLVAGKYLTILGLLASALVITAVVGVVASFMSEPIAGGSVPAGVTASALLGAHGTLALVALASTLLTIAYASAATVLTRSTIGGAIVAIVAVTIEGLFARLAPLLWRFAPDLVETLLHVLPSYHFENLRSWIVEGTALVARFPEVTLSHGWGVSLAVLAAWIGGLIALATLAFRRQDLN